MDSHADNSFVGRNALIIHERTRSVRVLSYNELAAPKTYSIVDAVVAYDDHRTGETAMLQINQAILVPKMTHNLL